MKIKFTKKQYIITAVIVLSIVVVSAGLFAIGGNSKIKGKTPEKIVEYLKSQQFQELDPNTRRLEAREAFREMANQRTQKYFELPEEERTAYLDETIDMMLKRRQERESQITDEQLEKFREGRRERMRNAKPEDRRARRESRDPDVMARNFEFRRALQQRMQQRGIEGFGGRGERRQR